MYLIDRKDFLLAGLEYPLGYPDTQQYFAEKGPSAPAGGYPQRIPVNHL
jgi:hypothetical protein